MDPLSVGASAIAAATLAAQTCSAFARLHAICKALLGRLHALNNEATDIEVVCYQVAAVLDHRASSLLAGNDIPPSHLHIRQLLKQATAKLTELRRLIDRIITTSERYKVLVFAVHVWKREQDRLQALQEDIKTVKCTLNIMLGASNSQDMTRIQLHIENISTMASQSAQDQAGMKDEFIETLSRHQEGLRESVSQVDERIGRVEELLKAQSKRLQDGQSTQLGPF